jgi:hypothetical protein
METNVTVHSVVTQVADPFGPEFPKINSCFKRNMSDGGVILPDQFSTDEFEYLANTPWTWTEKVDGTNVRLHFTGENIAAGGRTKDAQMPGHLMYALAQYNDPVRWRKVFDPDEHAIDRGNGFQPVPLDVTVYGEGYGPKIQNGGRYRNDVGFIVFDVRVGRFWLKREDIIDVAQKLGMDVVPVIATCSLNEAITIVKNGVNNPESIATISTVASWAQKDTEWEGLVGTPTVPLFDRRGQRIITKLKVKDFTDLAKREARRAPVASKVPSHPANAQSVYEVQYP